MASTSKQKKCDLCQNFGDHWTQKCPYLICAECKESGHSKRECPYRTRIINIKAKETPSTAESFPHVDQDPIEEILSFRFEDEVDEKPIKLEFDPIRNELKDEKIQKSVTENVQNNANRVGKYLINLSTKEPSVIKGVDENLKQNLIVSELIEDVTKHLTILKSNVAKVKQNSWSTDAEKSSLITRIEKKSKTLRKKLVLMRKFRCNKNLRKGFLAVTVANVTKTSVALRIKVSEELVAPLAATQNLVYYGMGTMSLIPLFGDAGGEEEDMEVAVA